MTLTLFGPEQPWNVLLNDEPIVSGRHPLHLYHGYLGAQSLLERGTTCCYDPWFQAGYPKSPVFDGGSRPAELFLCLAGGTFKPAAYKIGVAACCLIAPFLLMAAASWAGLGRGDACLATALGLLVWWGTPCRHWLEEGDLDLLLAGLGALAHVGALLRFHRVPSLLSWTGVLGTSALCWFGQPFLCLLLLPLILVYYLSVGAKHQLAWHIALLGSLAGGMAVNGFWLIDWFAYWWIRSPVRLELPLLPHRTFHTFWDAPLWGDALDRWLAVAVMVLAAVGIGVLNETKQRPAARLLGLGTAGFFVLAFAGIAWEPPGCLGAPRLLVPALWFAALPAAHVLGRLLHWVSHCVGGTWRVALPGAALLGLAAVAAESTPLAFACRCAGTVPLRIGLAPADRSLVEAIAAYTTPESRILWEDLPGQGSGSCWTALLPLLTGRTYIGGLDPDPCIEHGYPSFIGHNLAGLPLTTWGDAELDDFCRHYNIGWILCRSAAASARFQAWPPATPIASFRDGREVLYRLPPGSIALKGQARLLQADCRHIALADIIPEDGRVVLSMHYQAGLHVSPSRVQIEKEPDPRDPIPFIRLYVPGPVSRLTLTWQPR
jgi:hypothetical protein